MKKTLTQDDRSQRSAQRVHTLLLFLLGVSFIAFGFKSYPAFIAVGLLFILVSYRGYTATRQGRKTPEQAESKH